MVMRSSLRLLVFAAAATLLALVGGALYLFCIQDRLIYFPSDYRNAPPPELIELKADSIGQRSWYLPPTGGARPARLWMVCGGNASLAQWWMGTLDPLRDAQTGWLLIEYPGYGGNPGQPSPASILTATEQAVTALAQHLGEGEAEVLARMSGFGHSLGAAALAQYAARHRLCRLVLVSPFTRMIDMARLTVGPVFNQVLRHRFDNRARLAEIQAAGAPPCTIIHGESDAVIPVSMGRDLAAGSNGWITYIEIPAGDHDGILGEVEVLRQAMDLH